MKHPSAWAQDLSESERVAYWKWRMRNMETHAMLGSIAAFIVGVVAGVVIATRFL